MKKTLLFLGVFAALFVLLAACAVQKPVDTVTLDPNENGEIITLPANEGGPAEMPARPGSGVTGDGSANLPDLVDVSGTVKEVNQDLVLITLTDGSDFMLRFGENTTWAEGVDKNISVGNTIACSVKPEPTFTTPSQGEVYEVTSNTPAN